MAEIGHYVVEASTVSAYAIALIIFPTLLFFPKRGSMIL